MLFWGGPALSKSDVPISLSVLSVQGATSQMLFCDQRFIGSLVWWDSFEDKKHLAALEDFPSLLPHQSDVHVAGNLLLV